MMVGWMLLSGSLRPQLSRTIPSFTNASIMNFLCEVLEDDTLDFEAGKD